MDIVIADSWLRKFLKTTATPKEIAKYLSLCGPSIERVKKTNDGDWIYQIEITTNRADCASVVGIAREAFAILPRFGLKTFFVKRDKKKASYKFIKNVKYLNTLIDSKLCPRFSTVLVKNVTVKNSPKNIANLLEKSGIRPINNIVDVSNFIMRELGQPVHTFDYDKIKNSQMILRESKKGEQITTLDGKRFKLNGGDIVIEDGSGKLIDLCGIMGGKNSAIDKNSKNVLLFVQTYNPHKIRRTSMSLAQRSEAAVLFEKDLDTELVKPAILSAIELIEKISGGKAAKEILDIYPFPYKSKFIKVKKNKIDRIIGIDINKKDMTAYLQALGFNTSWEKDKLKVIIPSFRSNDVNIDEDIAEEVARIYGYHNLQGKLMEGSIPNLDHNNEFIFERSIKNTLKSLGGIEVYNLSLVAKEDAGENALQLKNPLGLDTKYLRTSIKPSLISNIYNNPQEKEKIHLFELADVYLPKKGDLPKEKLVLAGIVKDGSYRESKGIVETLLDELEISCSTAINDGKYYLAGQKTDVYSNKILIGEYGNLEQGYFYYEFDFQKLLNSEKVNKKYEEVPKYPPQIEDITFVLPEKTRVGELIKTINSISQLINKIELKDVFKDAYTFNIWFQHPQKTLTNDEVKNIREKIIKEIKSKFGAILKS